MSEVAISYKGSNIATMDASGTKTLLTQGKYCEDDIDVVYTRPATPAPTLQTKTKTYTPTESQQTESIAADSGYDGLSAVNVTVNAMPSGTAGTPTATKGTVSNHAVSVTPSVTNTTGYITGGTKNGTAVSVSASELVSGNKAITSNGTGINVANYATASVSVTPSLRTITITPSSTTQTYDPNYDAPLADTLTLSGEWLYVNTTINLNVSLNIVSGHRYKVSGWYRTGNMVDSASVSGEWVCGESLLPLMTNGSSWFSSITLTPTKLTYLGSSTNTTWSCSMSFYDLGTHYDGFSLVTVNAASGGTVGTKTVTNSSATATSLAFSSLSGTPKAFFVRCLSQLTRSSSYSYYYITAVRYNGTNTNGNYWRMSNGTFYADTSHYSFTYSNGTLTVKSSGGRGSAGGSFYNGDYELTYIY